DVRAGEHGRARPLLLHHVLGRGPPGADPRARRGDGARPLRGRGGPLRGDRRVARRAGGGGRHRAGPRGRRPGAPMRFVDEFRDAELGRVVAGEILASVETGRHYKVMEVCGGHTHSIYKYGVDDLLPANVELVHGPGCPVCVIPMGRVDDGIAIAHEPGVIFACFGDMLRVPGSNGSLLEAKAQGADVRMVYSPLDALRIARQNPAREVGPYDGDVAALRVLAEVFELRPHFEWRGLGFISQSALKLSAAYADLDAELRFSVPGVRVADPKACQCGEVLKGVIKPWECK